MAQRRRASPPGGQVVSPDSVARLIDFLEMIGADVADVARGAGVALQAQTPVAAQIVRLPPARLAEFYAHGLLAIEAEANQQAGRPALALSEYRLLCYCIISCANLREAIHRAGEFLSMLAPRSGTLRLRVQDGLAELEMISWRSRVCPSTFISIMIGLTSFSRLFAWLTGEPIELVGAETSYPRRFEEWSFLANLNAPLRFDGRSNKLLFSADVLDRPIVRDYGDLLSLLERFPFHTGRADYQRRSVTEHVRTLMTRALLAGDPPPTMRVLARSLHLSCSTFRRRLADEGTSLSQLKRDCRKAIALELLKRSDLPLPEIGTRVGFSDAATFRRAFKAWTGEPPTSYRTVR